MEDDASVSKEPSSDSLELLMEILEELGKKYAIVAWSGTDNNIPLAFTVVDAEGNRGVTLRITEDLT